MNKPYAIIFFGILAIVIGIGKDETEFIPSELKLTIGILLIAYGIYLIYGFKEKVIKSDSTSDKKVIFKKIRPSYVYLGTGVLTMKLTQYLITKNDHILTFWIVLIGIIGFIITIYGLKLFFKERKDKKESGSIK